MKYWKSIYLATLVALLPSLAACSSGDEDTATDLRHEIRFTSNLTVLNDEAVTRAYGNYSTYIAGQKFWVWADMYDAGENVTTSYFNAWQLTVSSVTTKFNTNYTKMFPAYNKLSFYTLHGNFSEDISEDTEEETGTAWPTLLTHTVKTSQITDADYQQSDLVYAINTNVMPTADPVNLVFQHLMAQVEVALVPGNGLTMDELISEGADTKATVTLLGLKTKVELRPDKTATINDYEGRELMLSNASEPEDITIQTVPTDDISKALCGAAVVVPQTVSGRFICINYLGYNTYVNVSNLRLKSGYRYRFNVTVDRIGGEYSLTPVTVAQWTDEATKREAELE